MLLLTHILIALASILCSALAFISPTKRKLRLSYSLVGLTLASGTYLVLSSHNSLRPACLSGLVYLALILPVLAQAQARLAQN